METAIANATATTIKASDLNVAAADLLDAAHSGDSPLRLIANVLGDLAAKSGLDRVVLGIDDARLGRQVFCSQRAPLNEATAPLFGAPRLMTEPTTTIDPASERLLVLAATAALATLQMGTNTPAPIPIPIPIPIQAQAQAQAATTFEALHSGRPRTALVQRLIAAAGAARLHNWGFAFVVARCDAAHNLGAVAVDVACGDECFVLDDHELAFIVPATRAVDIPARLAEFADHNATSSLTFGVAMCPSDSTDPSVLLNLAATRLVTSIEARKEFPGNPSAETQTAVRFAV